MVIKKEQVDKAVKQPRRGRVLLKLKDSKRWISLTEDPDNPIAFQTLVRQLHYDKVLYKITVNEDNQVSGFDYDMTPEAQAIVDAALGQKNGEDNG